MDSCTWKRAAEGQLAGDGMDSSCLSVNTSKSSQKLLHQSFSFSTFQRPLSPHEALVFYLHFFTSVLCVQGWFEGYNLEETWDPIIDTNIQSPHAALSPPVSHMLVTVAGLCLPGTRQPTCLSHSGSDLQFLSYFEKCERQELYML